MLLRSLAVFSFLSGVLSEITSQEFEYDVVNKVYNAEDFECVDVGAQGTLNKIAINATMQMTSSNYASDFFIAVYDPVNETGRQVGGDAPYYFKTFIADKVLWDSSLFTSINGNVAEYADINPYTVKSTDQVCYGNGYPQGGRMTVGGKIVLTLEIVRTDPTMDPTSSSTMEPTSSSTMEPTHTPTLLPTHSSTMEPTYSVMPTLSPQVVEYDVVNKLFGVEDFECFDVGAQGTLTKIAINVNMQMSSFSWASDFFIAVYDPVNETGRRAGGAASYEFKPYITNREFWHTSLRKTINGNVASYLDITAYTVKATDQVCYGNGYPHGGSMTVDGKIVLSDMVESQPSSSPSMEPTHAPTMEPTYSVMPTLSPLVVEYDVVNKLFGAEDFECVDVGAQGTLTKIAINVNMQMSSSSWASDFFIAVYDPVNETGRRAGGDSLYYFKPYITNREFWHTSLRKTINGNVASYLDITAYTVKATDQVCYGNGFQLGGNMTVDGKIVLSDLVESQPSSSPSMELTHAPTMEPTHSVMPTLSPLVVEYDVVNKLFGAEDFECVDVGAQGTLTKIAINVNMQMSSSSWASDFFIAVYDPVNETGRRAGGDSLYYFKPYITNREFWHTSLRKTINGNVASYLDITAYTVKATDQVCYGNGFQLGGNMTVDGKIVLSDLVESRPSGPPTVSPTPVSCMAKPKQVGNGVCNKNGKNNVESCMWDGGDCCEQSCVNNPDPKYAARCGRNGYQCVDPAYASSPTAAPGQEECTAPKPHSVGNGVCNHNNGKNNVADCGWDGGDCCEESCLDNPNPKHVKRCGMRGYHCLDPAYANSPTAAPGPAQCLAKPKQLGNGICNKNGKNNKAECGWDGGDCCEVSCLSNPNPKKAAKCGNKGYQCLDPQYVV